MTRVAIELRHRGEREPVPIVSDAAIMSRGIADGKLIPLVILDTTQRPDIDEIVQVHQHVGAGGDVETAWLRQSWRNRGELRLMLHFIQPVTCVVLLNFELQRFAGFIDQIVHNEAIYIQPGRAGDRLKNTLTSPRIIVEIDCENFRPTWDRIFERAAAKNLRRRGMTSRRAKEAAGELMREWREFTLRRMGEYKDGESEDNAGA